jgi:hypothetical protein
MRWPLAWYPYLADQSINGLVGVPGTRLHQLLADFFVTVLDDVWGYAKQQLGAAVTDHQIRAWLHEGRLDQHSGGFNFRNITGGRKLSLHSYGIALDWDPEHNPRKKPLTRTLPDWWYDIWKPRGWSDGRHYSTPDPMHVQFATGA